MPPKVQKRTAKDVLDQEVQRIEREGVSFTYKIEVLASKKKKFRDPPSTARYSSNYKPNPMDVPHADYVDILINGKMAWEGETEQYKESYRDESENSLETGTIVWWRAETRHTENGQAVIKKNPLSRPIIKLDKIPSINVEVVFYYGGTKIGSASRKCSPNIIKTIEEQSPYNNSLSSTYTFELSAIEQVKLMNAIRKLE